MKFYAKVALIVFVAAVALILIDFIFVHTESYTITQGIACIAWAFIFDVVVILWLTVELIALWRNRQKFLGR